MPAPHVAVIGGGIAGMSAALELSRHDLDIHLIEKSHFLGGQAIHYSCKANGTCQGCNACLVEEQLKRINEAENVHLHLASRIRGIEQKGGTYQLETRQLPLFDSEEEQEALGRLALTKGWEHVVQRGPSGHNSPLYALNWSAIEETPDLAETVPEAAKRLNLKKKPRSELIQAEAVIPATGFQPFDPRRIGTFNYPRLSNVVSALDMEKIRRSSGYHLRPSDSARPGRIAFIQCVGSRSMAQGNLWCSRVCCPYALRMARAMQAEQPGSEITFFYMDLQNCGRNSEKTLSTCRSDFRFVRIMPVDILPGDNDSPIVRYMSREETIQEESFDLVVLSVGMEPGPENARIARMLDIGLNRHGFLRAESGPDGTSSQEKVVFPAGAATGPKDIAESMEQATEAVKDLLVSLNSQGKKNHGYERSLDFHANTGHRSGSDRPYRSP
ncbi:MAG: FAD-dependent oxidoreductase [Desulfohalobiaceae bacterium]|nr:FAD-dependent oxidoreductase [Desulfohalobiaceae bacterium]